MAITNYAGTTAIVGIGATPFTKASGRTPMQLAVEACSLACEDAGLDPARVNGIVTFAGEQNPEIEVARNLGVTQLRHFSMIGHGGGAPCGTIAQAAMAVASGQCEYALAYRAFNERSWHRFGTGTSAAGAAGSEASQTQFAWTSPYGLLTPASWIAMFAMRYMHEYGATSLDFGRVAVADRKHAATNPKAYFYQRPITLEEHQDSRWIVEPLHLLDCCQESDGGQALLVTTLERAKDLKGVPAVIAGAAQGVSEDQHMMRSYFRDSITGIPELKLCADQLWAQSGLSAADIDAAILYDHFSPLVLPQLEEFGFCERGEAKDFIADGAIELGGRLPINTHGGQLGEAYIHGMNGIAEAVRLVRGTSVNQVEGAENVIVTAGTAIPTSALLVQKYR